MKLFFKKHNEVKIISILSVVVVAVVGLLTFAFSTPPTLHAEIAGDFMPVADGYYHQWSRTSSTHYKKVDETPCNGNANKIYVGKNKVGYRDSLKLDISSIPDGTTVTSVTIKPCAGKYTTRSGTGIMNVFFRFDGVDSVDLGNYYLSNKVPVEQTPTVFSNLSFSKTSTSTLEIGAVYSGGSRGVKLSRIAAEITYEFPPEPPVVTLTNPPDSNVETVNQAGGTTSATFTADIDTDVADLTSVELIEVSGTWPAGAYTYSCPSSNCQEISQGNWQATFAINNMNVGSYIWNIKAVNNAGQNSQASLSRNLRIVESPTGPNIVFILTDDQRYDEVHEIPGTSIIAMPNVVNRLLDKGVEFTNSFVNTSLCCPDRSTLLSGLYAFHHGVLSNMLPYGAPAFNDATTTATILRDAGYKTALIGKYLNKYTYLEPYPYIPPGWDKWAAFALPNYYGYTLINENANEEYYGTEPVMYSSDVLTQKAIDFINQSVTGGDNFFLELTYYAPHKKGSYSIPAPRHDGIFSGIPPNRPPGFNEQDTNDKTQWGSSLPLLTQGQIDEIDQRRIKGYESLQAVDEGVASIMDTLQNLGIDDNTVVIYMSDNGYSNGEHRRFLGKNCIYEECLRVPLIIRAPMFIGQSQQDTNLVTAVDIFPTILDLAGVAIPSYADGKSLLPILTGTSTPFRSEFLFEHWGLNLRAAGHFPTNVGIRNNEWTYAEFPDTGERQLFNLVNDPYQLNSLDDDPAYAGLMQSFSNRIQEIRSQ